MAQIGTVKVYTATGMQEMPVFALGDSGADIYEILKVRVDGATGFIPMANPAGGTPDRPFLKVYSDVGGGTVLEGHSAAAFAPVCPSYTAISTFAGSPADFIAGNFENLYGSPASNFVQVASPVPSCGDSNQSLRHDIATASTAFSNATYWTAAAGNNIELFAQFTGTSNLYNIVIIYFGATSFSNTYRAMFDWGNSLVRLQKGGSDLITAAITSRPTGQFCNLVVDYRKTDAGTITIDLLDDVEGASLISGGISSTNTDYTGSRVGMYVKSRSGDPIYVNALRTVP